MAEEQKMIEPFEKEQVRKGNISFGPSSFGYDIRLNSDFKLFYPPADLVIDPKEMKEEYFRPVRTNQCTLAPHSFLLGKSFEYLRMPDNVLGIVTGKSTYARCGIIVNVTPLEPGWEGFLTISISNTSPCPVRLHSYEGIAQIIFFESTEKCAVSYRDKKGKYQGQQEITLSKIEGEDSQ